MLTSAAAVPEAIQIDSVPDKYAMQEFQFEISPETGNVGIRLEYSYPPARLGGDDSDRGPLPKVVMLPGLIYDKKEHAVVYDDGNTHTICAFETGRRALFARTSRMKPTGACVVATRVIRHAEKNGWTVNRFGTLDAYFEVRRQ